MGLITQSKKFLTGAMYAPFCRTKPAPIEEWDNDLKNMAELGYNCVHGFAEWHDIEYEKGRIDFTLIDHMVECAVKHNIMPIINVATQNSVGFYSPRWLMEEYRGTGKGFIDKNGQHMMQGQFNVPCIDDPIYQAYAQRFLKAVAQHFANDDRIGGYVLWGEPTLFRPGSGNAAICYCEHTIAKFRVWLKEKYKDIANLNEAWGTEGPSDYIDFCQVLPPSDNSRQLGGFVSWEDWRSFMETNLSDHIKAADCIFKENGAMQPTITEMLTGINNGIDSWKLSECTDIIGISCFDKPTRMTALYMCMSDSMAKAYNKPTFVVEAAGGSVKSGVGAPKTPSVNQLKSALLQRAGYGTKGLMYWCWRPRLSDTEGNDFGLVKPNGKILKKAVEVGVLSEKLNDAFEVYNSSERKAEVAVFTSQHINHLMDTELMNENYLGAVIGANYILSDLHINSDFICEKEIIKGSLSKYKVLVLPCSYILSEECAEKIEAFVRNGGTVIADFILAEKRPGGICYMDLPGGGLDKVFGIDRDDVLYIEHPSLLKENTAGARLQSFIELVSVTDAEVVEKYDEENPLITKNKYGKGNAVYFTSQFFSGYSENPSKEMRDKIENILKNCNVTADISLKNGDLMSQTSLITTVMYDKKTNDVSVVTVTNSCYDEVEDTLILPKGEYVLVEEAYRYEILNKDTHTEVKFKLEAWESLAVCRCN